MVVQRNKMSNGLNWRSQKQWADFVDNHDTSSLWDKMEVVDSRQFRVKKEQKAEIRLTLNWQALEQLKTLAKRKKMSPKKLLRQHILEWLNQETT